jgi:hypothetical protein
MSGFAKYHKELKSLMEQYRGKVLKTAEIKRLFSEKYPKLDVSWVHPSDHCDNHTCKGACDCSETNDAIFSRVKHAYYLVK